MMVVDENSEGYQSYYKNGDKSARSHVNYIFVSYTCIPSNRMRQLSLGNSGT